jgi:hypothetical protein
MMNEPTNRATTANTISNVLKKPNALQLVARVVGQLLAGHGLGPVRHGRRHPSGERRLVELPSPLASTSSI